MKFCVEFSPRFITNASPGSILSSARIAESVGIESIWLPEDPFHWDAFAVLGAIATATDRIRLGTGVTNSYLRAPHLQAMSVSTLDRLSNGRAFLGLGRSLPAWYQQLLSINVCNPLNVMEETVSLLRQWWQQPYRASSSGYFNVNKLSRGFGGIQRQLPIYIAAVGPKMLKLAANIADGVILSWPSVMFLEQAIPAFKQHVMQSGRNPNDVAIIVQTGFEITKNRERTLEKMKDQMAVIYSVPGFDRVLQSKKFNVAEIITHVKTALNSEQILSAGGWTREFRETADWEAVRAAIPLDLIDQVAIVGPSTKIRATLENYHNLHFQTALIDLGFFYQQQHLCHHKFL